MSRSSLDLDDPDYQPPSQLQLRHESAHSPYLRSSGENDNERRQPCSFIALPIPKKNRTEKYRVLPNSTSSHGLDHADGTINHGKSDLENALSTEADSSFKDPNLVGIYNSITKKYGDIGEDCLYVDPNQRICAIKSICKIVQDLEGKSFDKLDEKGLSFMDSILKNVEYNKLNVTWLRQRIGELLEAVISVKEAETETIEKNKLISCIENMKKNVQTIKNNRKNLKNQQKELESEIAVKTNDMGRQNCKISGLVARSQRFRNNSLIDGLL